MGHRPRSKVPDAFVAVDSIFARIPVHLYCTVAAAILFIPAYASAGLPVRLDWFGFAKMFWISLAVRAIFAAAMLYVIEFPAALHTLVTRYRDQKVRLIPLVLFATAMIWQFGIESGVMVSCVGIVLAECFDRVQGDLRVFADASRALLGPALYLFVGLVLVFGLNDPILSLRFSHLSDSAFLRADAYLMHGLSVSELSRNVGLSPIGFHVLELIYYGMFGQIGAALIFISLRRGRTEAFQYVGAILSAYYIAVITFFLWPSLGPFYTCIGHFGHFGSNLETYGIQAQFLVKSRLLAEHQSVAPGFDYFIAFPCLHIAQPIIALWFMRPWKRIALCLAAYDVLLVPAILLLEWHYVVDVIGGVAVALAALLLNANGLLKEVQRRAQQLSDHTRVAARVP